MTKILVEREVLELAMKVIRGLMYDNSTPMAHDFAVKMDAILRALLDAPSEPALEQLEQDAARGCFMIDNGCWHRGEEQTHLAVLVMQGSNLSCKAGRRAAIDAAMGETK